MFSNAKNSEVSSFLRTAAVRRCLDEEELREAKHSGRILKSRWVLVWKSVPDESRGEALEDARPNPKTTHRKDGTKKAKARIVVLGYQPPDLYWIQKLQLRHQFSHRSCVICLFKWWTNGSGHWRDWIWQRRSYRQDAVRRTGRYGWKPYQNYDKLFMQAEDHEVLRILKNVYGNATAPRGLWKHVDETFQKLGAGRKENVRRQSLLDLDNAKSTPKE